MKTNFLFPNRLKKIGWFFLIPSSLLLMSILLSDWSQDYMQINVFTLIGNEGLDSTKYFSTVKNSVLDDILMLVFIISGLLVAFSKEKIEDEMVAKIRLDSLVWATYANYSLLILAIIFIYGAPFFTVMLINMFALLIFFIIRFHWMLYKNSKISPDEE